MIRVAHLLSGLEIGGKERAALRLAGRGRQEEQDHRLVLFDHPFRSPDLDFPPGEVPTHFIRRPPALSLSFTCGLARLLRLLGTEVVHAHNDTALVYAAGASVLCRTTGRGVRVVVTFHTWPSHPSANARRLTRFASRVAEVAAVSDELGERLLGGGWLGRCGTVWNGVDLSEFSPGARSAAWRERLEITDGQIVLGLVARLDPIKRHSDLIVAARLLQERVPAAVFVVVGQGPLREELRRSASDLPSIRWIDSVADMPGLFRSLDGLILCSAHEAAPLVLLEAMACGISVIASAVGGIPYLLASPPEASAGMLVPPLEPIALARAIENFATDPDARADHARAALARATRFSFEREWASYQALYAGEGSVA